MSLAIPFLRARIHIPLLPDQGFRLQFLQPSNVITLANLNLDQHLLSCSLSGEMTWLTSDWPAFIKHNKNIREHTSWKQWTAYTHTCLTRCHSSSTWKLWLASNSFELFLQGLSFLVTVSYQFLDYVRVSSLNQAAHFILFWVLYLLDLLNLTKTSICNFPPAHGTCTDLFNHLRICIKYPPMILVPDSSFILGHFCAVTTLLAMSRKGIN